MKHILLILLFSLVSLPAMSQHPIDNDKIMTEVNDAQSPYYYPNLLGRYQLGDTTLNLQDYRHLYYGYVHQLDYKPFDIIPEKDSVSVVMENMKIPTDEAYRKMLHFTQKVLEKEPFNPRDLNMEAYLYSVLKDTVNAEKAARKLDMVLEAIRSTGTGLTEESPWQVIMHDHATDLLDYMNMGYQRRLIVSRDTEYFPLIKRQGDVKGYYFDISRIYLRRPDYTPEKKRKMEFNPYYNPRSDLYIKPRGK